ncbi:hypothetical protein TorRG33x02_176290 [Trema orientale]|uniref:Uncharacterized protein n=1 Tax=Trema orientale TaxID=63057 RepID=A0A2P5EM14_TREOI|nr:hypothetical protein TorRG33x02_176290 [Trema orientale]
MRRKEAGEPPAATKVRRVGEIIHCKKCGQSSHNSKGYGKPKGKKVKKNNKQTNKVESSNPAKKLPVLIASVLTMVAYIFFTISPIIYVFPKKN